jgi:hypothetical protein
LAIAAEFGVARHTVQHWRDHFAAGRVLDGALSATS